MNGKSRFFHSFLIAIVAGFSYYILADVDFETLKMKTFSSLGIPYKMYEINNSVVQKKLPMPKIMYTYQQQDVLKDKTEIESIASYDEFIEGLNSSIVMGPEQKISKPKTISDIYQNGMKERSPETIEWRTAPLESPAPNKECAPVTETKTKINIKTEISKDDIEMYISQVSDRQVNVKKIEECFKKVKVIVGNENGGFLNAIVNVNIVPNIKSGSNCQNTTNIERRRMKKAPAVATSDDEEESDKFQFEEESFD